MNAAALGCELKDIQAELEVMLAVPTDKIPGHEVRVAALPDSAVS